MWYLYTGLFHALLCSYYLIFANDHMFEVDLLCRFIDNLSTITVSIYLRKNGFSCQTHTMTYSYSYTCQHLHLHSSRNLWTEKRKILTVPITLTYPFSNLAMAHFSKVFKIQSLWSSTWSSEARWYPLGVAPYGWTMQSGHSISLFVWIRPHTLVEFWILCLGFVSWIVQTCGAAVNPNHTGHLTFQCEGTCQC